MRSQPCKPPRSMRICWERAAEHASRTWSAHCMETLAVRRTQRCSDLHSVQRGTVWRASPCAQRQCIHRSNWGGFVIRDSWLSRSYGEPFICWSRLCTEPLICRAAYVLSRLYAEPLIHWAAYTTAGVGRIQQKQRCERQKRKRKQWQTRTDRMRRRNPAESWTNTP
jgi:hypothetical protein